MFITDEPIEDKPTIKVPQDKLLAELVLKHKDAIWKIHDHDSLLEHQETENLSGKAASLFELSSSTFRISCKHSTRLKYFSL